MTDNNEATDLGGRTEVGYERTTYWVCEDDAILLLDEELHTETSTGVFGIFLTQLFVSLFSSKRPTEMDCNIVNFYFF